LGKNFRYKKIFNVKIQAKRKKNPKLFKRAEEDGWKVLSMREPAALTNIHRRLARHAM
jgi:hypothetical protein